MKQYYFVFCGGDIMLEKLNDGSYTIPYSDCPPTTLEPNTRILTVSPLDGDEVKTYRITSTDGISDAYEMCPLRQSYYHLAERLYLVAGKCEELLYWDGNTQYCGRCGGRMKMHTAISKRCDDCGKEVWPQLSTAVIVLIHRGKDDVLLVHAHNFRGHFFGLVAGFVETGETLEEAVRREVMEETALRIKNLRYFGSQPWPYPCGLMVGFHADYESGEVRLQTSELAAGQWFNRHNLPELPEKLSIARRLIDDWLSW